MNGQVKMNKEQIEIFAVTMALMIQPLEDEGETFDLKLTAKEYGLFALGLMLLDSFTPTKLLLGDQIKAAQKRLGDGDMMVGRDE